VVVVVVVVVVVGFTLVASVSGIAQAVRPSVYGLDDRENGVRYYYYYY